MIIGKQKMKTVILTLSNEENGYDKMVQSCRDTWAKNPPENTKVFYNYGETFLQRRKIDIPPGHCTLVGEDCIGCMAPESYGFLLAKTVMAFNALLQSEEFDYLVRPNCGSYLNLDLLNKFLESAPREKYYCGKTGEWNDITYVSGSCMIFSRDVVQMMVDNADKMHYDGRGGKMDDVAIGEFLTSNGIVPCNNGQRVMCEEHEIADRFDGTCYHHHFKGTRNSKCHHLIHERFAMETAQ